MAVHPFESAAEIVAEAKAWAVTDCICRKQQALLGQGCDHPLDVCMVFSETPGALDRLEGMRALTQDEAYATLRRVAEAGLVHSVSNNQHGLWYLCNCCTCSCAILRGMAELGMANVIAASAFVCQVDEEKCIVCGECVAAVFLHRADGGLRRAGERDPLRWLRRVRHRLPAGSPVADPPAGERGPADPRNRGGLAPRARFGPGRQPGSGALRSGI